MLASAALLGWVWAAWHASRPLIALTITLLILGGHAVVLGLECVLAAWVNRRDPRHRATWQEWLHAWWQEVLVAPKVFAWRQPWRWRQWPDDRPGTGGAAGPVVMLHGFICNRGFWLPWMRACSERGLPYVSVNLEPVAGPIEAYVSLVEDTVCRAEALGGPKPSLLCHSMGGLVARAWLASAPGNIDRIARVITIGTPHHGTWLAHWSHLDNGRQMRPGGPWLTELERQEAARGLSRARDRFVCWYANTDNIVFPAATATLAGADNRLVRAAAHVDLAFHPEVMAMSLSMLASGASSPAARTRS